MHVPTQMSFTPQQHGGWATGRVGVGIGRTQGGRKGGVAMKRTGGMSPWLRTARWRRRLRACLILVFSACFMIFAWICVRRIFPMYGYAESFLVPIGMDTDRNNKEDAPTQGGGSNAVRDRKSSSERLTNLGNMEMPTRSVNGTRKPCLELLAAEEVEMMQLPPPSYSGVLTRLAYKRLSDSELEGNRGDPLDLLIGRTADMEPFTGKQTIEEREQSYQVRDGMEVHCGFAGDRSGFWINPDDQRELNQCMVVVVTCTFGGGDGIFQPIGMTNTSLKKVCYVSFWDETTAALQAEEGMIPDPLTKRIGVWRIVVVKDLPFTDQRRNGKIPKMLQHRLFPNARYSIWVDSKYQLRRDPMGVLEALLWRTGKQMALSEHGGRSCVYEEGSAIVKKNKGTPEEVHSQLSQYRKEGLPVFATFDGQKALAECSVIIREHTPLTNLFMCLWFNEVCRFTARDQLSFGHVLRRLQLLHINMFPVCMRRALVNVIGHKKRKPVHPNRPSVGVGLVTT